MEDAGAWKQPSRLLGLGLVLCRETMLLSLVEG